MLIDSLKNIVTKYPAIERLTRTIICGIPYSLRLGRDFWQWFSFFEMSSQWSVPQMKAYQVQSLRDLLVELHERSPFYRDRIELTAAKQLNSVEELPKLVPTLTRGEFAASLQQITAVDAKDRRLISSRTSGTTGMALQFCHERKDEARERAAIAHQWARVGYRPGVSLRAEFRGALPTGMITKVFPDHMLVRCSILHMAPEHLRFYAEAIKTAGARFYHGYPSALYLLADTVRRTGLIFPQPMAILLASESVHNWQVKAIREAFPEAKIIAHYGCAERTVLGAWCEKVQEYHILPQYSVVEVDSISQEIIGTNLFNTVNGFLRYRMTDAALSVGQEACRSCGRPYLPLLQVAGRLEDFLFSQEKGWIPPAIVTYPLKNLRSIRELQFVQKEKQLIRIRFTAGRHIKPTVLSQEIFFLEEGLHRLFGKHTRFTFEQVSGFERSASGKFRWIICELEERPGRSETNDLSMQQGTGKATSQ